MVFEEVYSGMVKRVERIVLAWSLDHFGRESKGKGGRYVTYSVLSRFHLGLWRGSF